MTVTQKECRATGSMKQFLIVVQANKRGLELGKAYDDPMKAQENRLADGCCNE